jgi:hypothetical protein
LPAPLRFSEVTPFFQKGAGRLATVDVSTIRALDFPKSAVRNNLDLFMDRSRASARGEGRSVQVALDGPADDVRVLYVVPSAPFVISYRVTWRTPDFRLLR